MDSYPFMDSELTRFEALKECRDRAGGVTKLGRDLGIKQATMSRIINSSKQLPAEYVLLAERLYGVSRHLLRPDIYPVERRFHGVDRRAARVSFQTTDVLKESVA